MPPQSIANATVKELFRGSAKFGRPSTKAGAGWIVTADKGNAIIQKQINKDGTIVYVVRSENYMGADGMNGRILPGLPIHRNRESVYFKTSSTTTLGGRHKAPFVFKFGTIDEAEEFEMWWLLKNGTIALWKEADAKKKAGSNSNNTPLQDSTNAESNPVRNAKRKADPMIGGPSQKKKKDPLNLVCINGGIDRSNDVENQPVLLRHDGSADDSVGAFKAVGAVKAVGLMPTEVNINGKVRKILKVKRSALKSITEDSISSLNVVGDDNSNDLNVTIDSSNDSSVEVGEDVIIDEEDAPQSQNWMTAFASYD